MLQLVRRCVAIFTLGIDSQQNTLQRLCTPYVTTRHRRTNTRHIYTDTPRTALCTQTLITAIKYAAHSYTTSVHSCFVASRTL